MPLLPGITDTEENLRALYDELAAAEVDFIMPGGLTLRPGRQKEFYLHHLAAHQPDLVPLYQDLYREERASGAPLTAYANELYPRLAAHNGRVGLPWLVPHHIYRGQLHRYDEVNVLLRHLIELYEARGINTRPLRSAMKRYLGWLEERKAAYNRHRSWRYEDLDAELAGLCLAPGSPGTRGAPSGPSALAGIMGNQKTADFVREIVVARRTFNYTTRELEDTP
jgi:hypothetical protein